MATYKVSARNKKSTVEFEYFVNAEDSTKTVTRELGWRWGEFLVDLTDEEFADIDQDDENGEFNVYSYENAELLGCTDGCWEEWTFSDNIDEAEQERVQEVYEEDYEDGLDAIGYYWSDSETIIYGPITLELVED